MQRKRRHGCPNGGSQVGRALRAHCTPLSQAPTISSTTKRESVVVNWLLAPCRVSREM